MGNGGIGTPGNGKGGPKGGGGSDANLTLVGTSGADRLKGGGGDDTFTELGGDDQNSGGSGTDTAIYEGSIFDFSWAPGKRGSYTITDLNPADGDEGTDSLTGIDTLQFADYSFSLVGENAPIIIADDLATDVDSSNVQLERRVQPIAATHSANFSAGV